MYCFYKMYGRTSPHAKFCDPKIKGQTTDRQTEKKPSIEKREKISMIIILSGENIENKVKFFSL